MKRLMVLAFLVLMLAAQGCSGAKSPVLPDRESLLPDDLIGELAGAPMELAYDRLDKDSGFACWAWQDTDGIPRLLAVEIRFPPADCDGLYQRASEGVEGIIMPEGATACYDGRAAHLRAGAFYARISALGFPAETEALRQVAEILAGAVRPNK